MGGPVAQSQLVFRGEIVSPAEVQAGERAAGQHSVLDVHQVLDRGERRSLVRVNFEDRSARRVLLVSDIERGAAAIAQFSNGERLIAIAALSDWRLLAELESGWSFAAAGWAFNR